MQDRQAIGNPHRSNNLSLANRLVRGGFAALLLALGATALTRASIFLALCALLLIAVALGLLATAVTGYCPVHARVYPDRDPKVKGLIAAVAPETADQLTDNEGEHP